MGKETIQSQARRSPPTVAAPAPAVPRYAPKRRSNHQRIDCRHRCSKHSLLSTATTDVCAATAAVLSTADVCATATTVLSTSTLRYAATLCCPATLLSTTTNGAAADVRAFGTQLFVTFEHIFSSSVRFKWFVVAKIPFLPEQAVATKPRVKKRSAFFRNFAVWNWTVSKRTGVKRHLCDDRSWVFNWCCCDYVSNASVSGKNFFRRRSNSIKSNSKLLSPNKKRLKRICILGQGRFR